MNLIFKNFSQISEIESDIVLNMRNSEYVRKGMYNSSIIQKREHANWLRTLANRNDVIYYLVYLDGNIIGVVNLTSITNEDCEWGYYLNEKYLNSGYGFLIEYYIIQYAFSEKKVKRVNCAVIDTNVQLYNAHMKYFGFTPNEFFTCEKKLESEVKKFNGLTLEYNKWLSIESSLKKKIQIFRIGKVTFE